MDHRLLRQFVNLADSLHFGRASESSHVSPSALSRNIRQLEKEVGAELFERNNRRVALTHAGGLFLTYARESLSQWDAIRNELMAQAGELHGEVSMYCSVTASYSFLYELLSRFRQAHPHVEIKLHTGDPEHAISRVVAGDEDIAIGARPANLQGGLAFKPIAVSPLVFIAPDAERSGHLFSNARGPLSSAEWEKVPMILSESGLARRRMDRWFRDQGIAPNIYAQVAGNEAIVSMVSLGFGIGVVPRIVLENSPLAAKVRILDIKPELEPYDVGLFTLQKNLRSPIIGAFWSLLK